MEARLINDQRQWNEFIEGAVQCNVTQSYEWGRLLTTLDGEVLYVGVVDDGGKICAAMLLLVSRVAVSNSVYFYAPRGPIIDNPESPAMAVLLNYVKALAHKYHAFMLKVEPGVKDNDATWLNALHRRGFVANPEALHLRHEWVLDIRPDEQTLLAGMKKTWRYCVRLASRKDVTVRRSESLADIATFHNILQTTSQRDTFMIYDKSFYEKLVELYGKSGNVALFIAEYEGQALGAALLVKMGRWCWYMYGASSNEHRDRMPNHLLQWTAMRWAKEQGCWYYNFRGIPDVLEESQPMWGVYVFKSGFGGYAMRSLETHDLAYNPLLYKLYRGWLDGRSWLKDVRAKRHTRQIEAEQQEKQSDSEQPKDVQQITQSKVEKPSKPDEVQSEAGSKPAVQKQPKQPDQQKQPKRPQIEPQVIELPASENQVEVRQEVVASPVVVPVAAPEPEKIEVEEESNASRLDEPSQAGAASPIEIPVALPEVEQAVEEVKSDADSLDRKEEVVSEVEVPATQPEVEQASMVTNSDVDTSEEPKQKEAISPAEFPIAQLEVEQATVEDESDADNLDEEVEEKVAIPVELQDFEQVLAEEKVAVEGSEAINQEESINTIDAEMVLQDIEQSVVEEKSDAGNLDESIQEEAASVVEVPVVQPEIEQVVVEEEKSAADDLNVPVQEEAASIEEVQVAQLKLAQLLIEEEGETTRVQDSWIEPEHPVITEQKDSEEQPVYRTDQPVLAEVQEHPTPIAPEQQTQEPYIQTEDTQKVRVPSFYVRPRSRAKQVVVPEVQISHDDKSIHSETKIQSPIEAQIQPLAEQLGGGQRSEEERDQEVRVRVEPSQVQAEARENQPESEVRPAQVEELTQPALQAEPAETKIEESGVHVKTKAEEVVEELERRANVRKRAEEELERQARARKQAEEDLDDQMLLNEETQKLPRVKMAQKYSGGRRPTGPNSTHDGMNGKSGKKG